MRNGNYNGGSVLTSVRIWNSTRAIQQGRNMPLGTLVNNCLDKLVHALQVGDVFSTQGKHLIERKGWREQWNEGTSTYTKIKIKRQNYDYIKMNILSISQCVNYAVKWYGVS